MEMVREIIRKKPNSYLIFTGIYLLLVVLLKWRIYPPLSALWFGAGGILGIYFMDSAEELFALKPSPFHSVLFCSLFVVVSFFVTTSSVSLLAQGLVLSLFLELILRLMTEWQQSGNISSWFRQVSGGVALSTQKWLMYAFIGIFLIETYLFIR